MLRATLLTVVVCLHYCASTGPWRSPRRNPPPSSVAEDAVRATFARRPIAFEPNEGQFDSDVRFVGRAADHSVGVTDDELIMVWTGDGAMKERGADVVRMRLVGAERTSVEAEEELPGRVNHLIGNDRSNWHTNLRTFAKVRRPNAYAGIDVVYYGASERLEYDFVIAPGRDPGAIRIAFEGAQLLEVTEDGDLRMNTAHGELRHHAPLIYQDVDGRRVSIAGNYVETPGDTIGFAVGPYDSSRRLVIDPVIAYSSYIGGNGQFGTSSANSVAVDPSGNVYITGTAPAGLPTLGGMSVFGGAGGDAFVIKLDSSGVPVYSTYVGGSAWDVSFGTAVDSTGVSIAGMTLSTNFPTVNAYQPASKPDPPGFDHQTDAFAAKLTPAGNDLVYSTYLGGTAGDTAAAIATDPFGNAYIVGTTGAGDFPVLNAIKPTLSGPVNSEDGFIVKLGPGGAGVYATFWGGNGTVDYIRNVAADAAGNVYVVGISDSTNLPLVNPYHGPYGGPSSAFVTKLSADGSTVLYGTHYGGSGYTEGHSIALGPAGNIFIAGVTAATNLPPVNAYQPMHRGGVYDMWVAKFSLSGAALDYATYLGGSDNDYSTVDIAVDPQGQAILTGATRSTNFPLQDPVQSVSSAGGNVTAAVVTKLTASGNGLVFSSYVGGIFERFGGGGNSVAADGATKVYVAGWTDGGLFTTPDAFQGSHPGSRTGFVLKLSDAPAPCMYDLGPAWTLASSAGGPGTFTVFANGTTCGWSGTSNASWIVLTGATSGIGTGVVPYSVSFNGGLTRAGTITMANKTFSIVQQGTFQPGCTVNVTPPTISVPGTGSTSLSANVTTSAGCAWTGISQVSWITVTGGMNGVGNGSVVYDIAPNPTSAPRVGKLRIGLQDLTVTQAAVQPPEDLLVNFGSTYGVYRYGQSGWSPLHSLSPEAMARGDLDGNGVEDLVMDFGSAGVWAWMNHATWTSIHPLSPVRMATGDLDGNGQDDLILEFSGYGVWVRRNTSIWSQLHSGSTSHIATGNLDGTGGDDLVINFTGYGIWRFANSTTWSLVHPSDATVLQIANIDGTGTDDLIVHFAGYGVWSYRNQATWAPLNPGTPTVLRSGDVDGDGLADLLMAFGSHGTWLFSNNATWSPLHSLPVQDAAFADLDGNGKDDIALDFGAQGLWVYRDSGTWAQLHGVNPQGLQAGRFH